MMKTLRNAISYEKEHFRVPSSAQQLIPINRITKDGIFETGGRKYKKFSKTFKFSDINYFVVSESDRERMFLDYCALLNSLDTSAVTKITINNRSVNRLDFERSVLIPNRPDGLNGYRDEYNAMLMDKVKTNGIFQDKYITVSVIKKNIEEARTIFQRVGSELSLNFGKLASTVTELNANERLKIFHEFFRAGDEMYYNFDLKAMMKRSHGFKNYICADSIVRNRDHICMDGRFSRILYMREYATYLSDGMVAELCALNKTLMLSIDIIPVPTDEAVRVLQNCLLGINTNAAKYNQRQLQQGTLANLPYEVEQQQNETKEMLNDITTRDQRMMLALITLVHVADSKEELDSDTETLLAISRKFMCQFSTMQWQQMAALNTVLPYGVKKIEEVRTMTTECVAALIPFKALDIQHPSGIYCGVNTLSGNLIMVNRNSLLNGNGFIFGVSGSGKSLAAKREMIARMLEGKDDIIVIDPDGEYSSLIKAMGGEIIKISSSSASHINAMDLNQFYSDDANPLALKTEFILSLCEQLIGTLQAKEKSIIDRCISSVYRKYIKNGYMGKAPNLQDFHAELLKQPEQEAKDIALALELFTNGSLNTFAKQSNVDLQQRILCFDIKDLGSQLKTIGMLVVLDAIWGRITRNREQRRNAYIYIDEIYVLFSSEYSRQFLFSLWKRVRKYGACCTGITQNVADVLRSEDAKALLANSEFLMMLNQAPTDRQQLNDMFHLSDTQLSYITNSEVGSGLLKVGGALVPFSDRFPSNTKLYKLMTTKIEEQ